MCGRFTLILDPEELRSELQIGEIPALYTPRYNIAPSQPVLAVVDPATREPVFLRWGLIPSWAKDIEIGNRLINARHETVPEKPSFRSAFMRRRCLILADGFYEWQKSTSASKHSLPYYFYLKKHRPFTFAGLWEIWHSPEGDELHTCTILTTNANSLLQPIHERMPVILNADQRWKWMESTTTIADLTALCAPYPAEEMDAHPVSTRVNSPSADSSELIRPAAGLFP